jgi:hypothetical protein
MRTKLLMSLSALFLGILGVAASFFPQEILTHFAIPANALSIVLVQITGALCLGFAILNWMARSVVIGGIYARPVALGNFMHFAVIAITLIRALGSGAARGSGIAIGGGVYLIFAAWFGLVLFTSPSHKPA